MLKLNRVSVLSSIVALSLSVLACWTSAVAQKTPVNREPKPTSTSPAVTDKTRSRRVAELSRDKTPAVATAIDTTPESPSSRVDDPVTTLREQIATVETAAERSRLRAQLVDYFVDAGKKSEAIAELHSMLAEDRFDPAAFYNIGNRFVQLGDVEAAISAYRIAIDQRNGNYSRALNNLGAVLFQQRRLDEAFEALTSALRHEKFHYAEASFNLGRLYAARGERNLAIREWTRALAVNPQHAGAARALANARSQGKVKVSGGPTQQPTSKATSSSSGAVGSTTNSQTGPRP